MLRQLFWPVDSSLNPTLLYCVLADVCTLHVSTQLISCYSGGDALASDLLWREIQKVTENKPVIASMGDVAASGGYYMAMAADKIVAENLTITGSIGVVLGKVSLAELYKNIGYALLLCCCLSLS